MKDCYDVLLFLNVRNSGKHSFINLKLIGVKLKSNLNQNLLCAHNNFGNEHQDS